MSQGIEGKLYATYKSHTCYMFETDIASAYAVEDVKDLNPTETRAIEGHLLEIMNSVRIVPPKR